MGRDRDVSDYITDARLSWESLTAVIGGRSAIDIPRLRLRTRDDAAAFLSVYGFDWSRDRHRLEIELLRAEAVSFIAEELLPSLPGLWMPADVAEQRDARELLVWASADERDARQRWACAVLRVMHTMAHAQSYFEVRFGDEVREQILARFHPHLHGAPGAGLTLGADGLGIPLASFEAKPAKPLRSLVIKLLHKVENVSTSVFDHIGVRFVTQERFDALLVVRYLRKHNVIMFANAMPSRSKNTLMDLTWVRERLVDLDERCARGELADADRWEEMRRICRRAPYPPGELLKNAHSSFAYHAIQFTCRQQVRVASPYAREVDDLLVRLEGTSLAASAEVRALRQRDESDGELHFFFPFEVQILDAESFEASRTGLASHAEYKARQLRTVQRRVLGALLDDVE